MSPSRRTAALAAVLLVLPAVRAARAEELAVTGPGVSGLARIDETACLPEGKSAVRVSVTFTGPGPDGTCRVRSLAGQGTLSRDGVLLFSYEAPSRGPTPGLAGGLGPAGGAVGPVLGRVTVLLVRDAQGRYQGTVEGGAQTWTPRVLPKKRWFRGNTHTHTLWSDGKAAPESVVDWYKGHGYQFLVLSDHNVLAQSERWVRVGRNEKVDVADVAALVARFGGGSVALRRRLFHEEMRLRTLGELRHTFEEPDRFALVKGEEITDKLGDAHIHHGIVNSKNLIRPTGGASVRDLLERTARAAEDEAARTGRPVLLHLNHPNYHDSVTADDLAHVKGERFFEVYNGHRGSRNEGDATHRSTEAMWDYAISLRLGQIGGPLLFALATDDAHECPGGRNARSSPGRGWVVVRSDALSPDAITRAMLAGDFYASSGVKLADVASDGRSLTVKIDAEPGVTYTTRFIGTRASADRVGAIGVVLKETRDTLARYDFAGDELYVRAQVVSSRRHPNGYAENDLETAWVQPVVVRRLAR